jgi:hypothetical protein
MNTDQLKIWGMLADQDQPYYVTASETERQTMREWVTGLLQTNVDPVRITFIKADGTERTMPCTLNESLLPAKHTSEKDSERKYNPNVCVVFDPERQVWRSFRWDRMKRIEFELG